MPITLKHILACAPCLWAGMSWADEVVLVNNDRLSGAVVEQSGEHITLQHAVFGNLIIPRERIASLQLNGGAQSATDSETSAQAATPEGTHWLSGWKRSASVGINGTSGRSDDLKISAGLKANYQDEHKRWAAETRYYRNSADGALTDHSVFASLRRDWLQPESPWFSFAHGRIDFDEFKNWDYRIGLDGGLGYTFIQTGNYRLLGRAGLGASHTFGGLRDEFTPEAPLGLEVDWKINDRQQFAFSNTLYPNLRDKGELRNQTTMDWRYLIDQDAGLSLKISLFNEYDSLSETGVSKYDFKYSGALEWSL